LFYLLFRNNKEEEEEEEEIMFKLSLIVLCLTVVSCYCVNAQINTKCAGELNDLTKIISDENGLEIVYHNEQNKLQNTLTCLMKVTYSLYELLDSSARAGSSSSMSSPAASQEDVEERETRRIKGFWKRGFKGIKKFW
jgi:hypothetical protein